MVKTLARGSAGDVEGTGTSAYFLQPYGVACSPDGAKAIVADTGNHKIREITVATGAVETLAGGSAGDGYGERPGANVCRPWCLPYQPNRENAIVSYTCNH